MKTTIFQTICFARSIPSTPNEPLSSHTASTLFTTFEHILERTLLTNQSWTQATPLPPWHWAALTVKGAAILRTMNNSVRLLHPRLQTERESHVGAVGCRSPPPPGHWAALRVKGLQSCALWKARTLLTDRSCEQASPLFTTFEHILGRTVLTNRSWTQACLLNFPGYMTSGSFRYWV